MTLALYGKSRQRRLILILAAFVAVAVAMMGGSQLFQAKDAQATAATVAAGTGTNCVNSSETDDDNGGACSADATTLADGGTTAHVETDDDSQGGTGFDDLTVVFDLSAHVGTAISGVVHVESAFDAGSSGDLVKVGSSGGGSQYGSSAPGSDVSYTVTLANVQAALGGNLTVRLSLNCSPNDNDCGILVDRVWLELNYTPKPDLTATKSNSVSGSVVLGNSFTWKIHVANVGTAPISFANAVAILHDGLPNGPAYSALTVDNFSGITNSGNISCVLGSNQFDCTSTTTSVTLAAGGYFDVTVTVTPAATGTLTNPVSGNTCKVNPTSGASVSEDATNNNCGPNTVTVTAPAISAPGGSLKLEQWEPAPLGSSSWITGALNAVHSDYHEGESVPFQLTIPSTNAAGTYQISACREYSNGAVRGYFSLTTYNFSRPAVPTGGAPSANSGSFSGVNVTSFGAITEVGGQGACPGAGDRETTVVFTKPAGDSYILWGSRLATPSDAGAGNSASNYPGGSLSMKTLPSKTVSIQTNAIIPAGNLVITKKDTQGNPQSGVQFSVSPKPSDGTAGTTTYTTDANGRIVVSATINKTYTATEGTPPSGYAPYLAGFTGTNCTSSTAGVGTTATITSSLTATCNFVNAPVGSITIIKDAVPNDAQDFAFTTTGTGLSGFSLDDDANGTLLNTKTFSNLAAGAFTVTESVTAGWDLTNLVCTEQGGTANSTVSVANRKATITLEPGEAVVCTFTNTKQGSITIIKDAVPNDAQDFHFTTGGTGLSAFDLDDDANATLLNTKTFSNLAPGAFTVTESATAGWDLTNLVCTETGGTSNSSVSVANRQATITLDPGESVSCTFTNTKRGHIVVDKVAVPGGDPQSFTFTTTGTGYSGFSLTDAATPNDQSVAPGTYTAVEGSLTGWDLTNLVCTDPTSNSTVNIGTRTATINVAAGETVTCTFTNTKRGHIIVDKVTVPSGDAQSFTFTAGGSGYSNFSLTDAAAPNDQLLPPGSYTALEGSLTGWDLTNLVCTDPTQNSTVNIGTRTATINVAAGETVTCTFTNTKQGSITIVKDAVPNDAQDFSFTTSGTGLSSFSLDDDADATLSNTKVFSNIVPGPYTVTEGALTGWDLTGLTCNDGNSTGNTSTRVATINVEAGESVTCTYTNAKRGTITIIKDAVPNDAQDFSFTTSGTGLSSFSLDDDADATLSNTKVFSNIVPGPYTVTEGALTGWDLTDLTCNDGNSTGNTSTRVATINVEAGESVTCTYTNTKRGTITIIKDAVPNDAQDFSFTTSGTGLSSFSLDDDADATLSNTKVFSNIVPGPYTVTEGALTGWDLTGLTCNDGNSTGNTSTRVATINVEAGESVTCTFTNTKKPQLTVTKYIAPTSDNGKFDLKIDSTTYNNGGTGYGNGGTTGAQFVSIGSHTVSETAGTSTSLSDYTAVIGGDCATDGTITLAAGDNKTCTITNTRKGKIIVIKDAVPNDAQDFSFTTQGTGLSAFYLDDDSDPAVSNTKTFTGLVPGSFTLDEDAVTGWDLTSIVCASDQDTLPVGSPDLNTLSVGITLHAGETVTCTFTNTKKPKLTVNKVLVPSTDGGLFNLRIDGSTAGTGGNVGNGGTTGAQYVTIASHTVSETAGTSTSLTDYTTVISGDCAANGSVTLAAGDNKTCTITNTKKPKLTVNKVLVPSGDGGKFNLQIDSSTAGTGANVGNGGTTGAQYVTIGSHTVGETAGTSTSLTDYTTVIGGDCAADGSITLAAGDNKTCTITNTKKPKLTVNKVLAPTSDTGLFNLQIDGLTAGTGGNVGNGGTTGAQYVSIGGHTAGETAGTSTSLSDYTAVISGDCAANGSITLAAGDNKTCTITNTRKGKIIVIKDAVPNDAQDFSFTTQGTGLSAFYLDDDSDPAVSNTKTFTGLVPGSFTLDEDAVTGWDLTSIVCASDQDTLPVGSPDLNNLAVGLTLHPGETITCTFTNTKRGTIVVKKVTDPSGSQQSFTFTGDASGSIKDGGSLTVQDVVPDTSYTSQETVPTGWDLTDITCDDSNSTGDLQTAMATFSVQPGETVTCTFTNTQRGHIIVDKVTNPSGSAQSFTFTTTGSGYSGFSLKDADSPNDQALPPGSYTVQESGTSGWDFTSLSCTTGGAQDGTTTTANITLAAGQTVTCTYTNTQRGTITVIKHDSVDTAHGGNSGNWNVDVTGPAGYTPSNPHTVARATGSNPTVYTAVVPAGSYTVSETNGNGQACASQTTKTFQTGFGSAGNVKTSDTVSVNPNQTTTVDIYNTDCGQTLGTANLTVFKVIDLNGNKTQDGGEVKASGWNITVACPGESDRHGQTNGNTPAVFVGLTNGKTCTISEDSQAGYSVIGWRSHDDSGPNAADGTGTSTTMHMDDGDINNSVTFYNQPRVNIHVHKTELTNAGAKDGKGWTFTLTGCGITPQVKTTDFSGNVDFTNLAPAVGCSYTVTETTVLGWTVSPAASQTTSPSGAGETANVLFTNSAIQTCGLECTPTTTTPTVVPPTSTPVPTNTPKPAPPEVTQLAGERTPGAVSTPLPPSTGSGFFGTGAGTNFALAVIGLLVLSSGFAFLAIGRKRS